MGRSLAARCTENRLVRASATWASAAAIVLALLMVSIFPYPKPNIGTLLRHQPWALLALGVGVLLSAAWTVWIVTAGYIALGPLIWLYRQKRSGVKD